MCLFTIRNSMFRIFSSVHLKDIVHRNIAEKIPWGKKSLILLVSFASLLRPGFLAISLVRRSI